jgi:hypothetical protein
VLFFHSLIENVLNVSGFTSNYPEVKKDVGVLKGGLVHMWYFLKIPLIIYIWTAVHALLFFIFLVGLKYMVLDVAKGEIMSDFASITFWDLRNMVVGAVRGRLMCVMKNIALGHIVITAVFMCYARPSKMKDPNGIEAMTRSYFVMLVLHALIVLTVEFVLPCVEK